ncbi:cell division protein PerM, partial [Angustibacter peucedani]
MSLLDRLRPDSRPSAGGSGRVLDDGTPAPVPPLMALLTGLWTAAVCWLAVTLPALLAWATSPQTTASWDDAVRVSTDVWLVLHRVGLDVPGGSITIAPLAGTALPVWLCWVAGRRIGHGLEPRDLAAAGSPLRAVAPSVAGLSVGYAVVLVLGAAVAGGDGFRPVVWQALLAGLLVPAVSGTLAALRAS